MAAPRASAESGNATLYVMIIFIVLFLVSTVFAVMMYMDNEKYKKDAQQAQDQLSRIGTSQEISALSALADNQRTVLRRLDADIKAIATMVGGPDQSGVALGNASRIIGDLQAGAFEKVEAIKAAADPELKSDTIFADATPENGLINLVNALVTQVQTAKQVKDQIKAQLNNAISQKDAEIAQLTGKVQSLQSQVDQLSQEAARYSALQQENLAKLTKDLETLRNTSAKELAAREKQNQDLLSDYQKLEEEFANYAKQLQQLEELLGTQRPRPDMEMEALQPDGLVVSVVPEDGLVYINLSKADPIYRGLTFSVYDSFKEFPKSGQGKGMIEIIEKMDGISKCRITEYDPTNPILKGDIIANLFWDKNKRYKFCVTGEFDFDNDGEIDPDGRDRIIELITANETWKGIIVDEVTVDTDFMIMGVEPAQPTPPASADGFAEVPAEVTAAYNKAMERYKQYMANYEKGKALGVPTFNTSRFFRFIGYKPGQER